MSRLLVDDVTKTDARALLNVNKMATISDIVAPSNEYIYASGADVYKRQEEMNMVIKCLLAALWLLAVPWAAGGVVLCKSKKSSMGMNLLAGYLMMFSFAEILALAAIWAKLPLHVLKYSLAAVMASAAVLGIVLARSLIHI